MTYASAQYGRMRYGPVVLTPEWWAEFVRRLAAALRAVRWPQRGANG